MSFTETDGYPVMFTIYGIRFIFTSKILPNPFDDTATSGLGRTSPSLVGMSNTPGGEELASTGSFAFGNGSTVNPSRKDGARMQDN